MTSPTSRLLDNFPIYHQLQNYDSFKLTNDLIAAIVVTIMLIPQSLAYSMLAGLPPQYGLYASITPLVLYALMGSSTSLAVGPVAIASIMTASSLASVTSSGLVSYIDGAITLALLSGVFLLVLGLFKFGFVANFLSHSVVSGFITASGLLIALSQVKHLLGVKVSGSNFFGIGQGIINELTNTNLYTLLIGLCSVAFLFWARSYSAAFLQRLGFNRQLSTTLSRVAPVVGVVVTSLVVIVLNLDTAGVAIVGHIPGGLGQFGLPNVSFEAVKALIVPAMLISIIGYVESISVGRTLAAKRDEKITPNQELKGLGVANLASGLSGAFPVTGGFARSVVNYDAGAATQMAGLFTAIGIALASLLLTPYLYYLPIAMLAAVIIVAVLSLVDFSILKNAWQFSKSDFIAMALTIALTLTQGVETGVAAGIIASILLHLYHTSKPHIAELGLLRGSEHFRNIKHFDVETDPNIIILRIDESLMFSNASYLEDEIDSLMLQRPQVKHIVLHFGAVNTIDLTALEMLESTHHKLAKNQILLHLTEVKIPIKKLLERTHFLDELSGKLFLSTYQAYRELNKANH